MSKELCGILAITVAVLLVSAWVACGKDGLMPGNQSLAHRVADIFTSLLRDHFDLA